LVSAPGSAAHLSPAELGQRCRAARSPIERSHLQIVWLLSRGRGEREVARVTGYGRRWVAEVVRRHDEDGPEGPGDRRRGDAGAEPLLGAEDEAALAEPPGDGGLWTGPKVAAWMAPRLGRKVWPQRGWDYLRKVGYSAQRPRPRHAKAASLEEQAAYKQSWPPRWISIARRSPGGRSRSGPSTSTGSARSRCCVGNGPCEDSGRSRSGGTATSGSTSTASSTRAPARWPGSCATPSTPCSSARCWRRSPRRSGPGRTSRSSWSSTTPAGTSAAISSCRRGSSWPSRRPTRPSCSRPSTCGRRRTRRSRTSTAPRSRISTRRCASAGEPWPPCRGNA
jgi:transposase